MEFTLECQTRPDGSKPRALRRSGQIPAVLYGHKGTESISLTVDAKAVTNLLKDPAYSSSLIQLTISDSGWTGKTLLKEVQTHPWKGHPYHLSFFAVAAHGDIDVEIPVRVVGESAAVKTDGCILETLMTAVGVKCNPDIIPESIEIDISSMGMGDSVQVKDLKLPEGVEAIGEPEQVVISIQGTRSSKSDSESAASTESA
ncbi:MAG TPA: 50S ribosomal protein L25/general stress protein Ctc [Oscillatoriales cyanobacterium M59_W2019_021]|nr:MAG: 50S ribosomal protein L25/general stress protein Ctc [Cyanobacteria bacterium J055]HIK30983.1 50S ribosomal protein L25/general stress protein Ctc [Oscillatoriales cyanobacterium M4454_W2019_049]HIK50847.1 50S ribosomal protein L25/general stress protein Ctc [Oscillatoriales cyanobacterium M59_W2019_021]